MHRHGAQSRLVQGEAPWPLLLTGTPGVGKTCAALCLLDLATGLYYTVEELMDALIAAQDGRYKHPFEDRMLSKIGLWEYLRKAPLVVLDELGSRKYVSDFAFETVKRLLDQRENRPLVCLSNRSLLELEEVYDDRVSSRLVAGTVIELIGPDRRLLSNGSPRESQRWA